MLVGSENLSETTIRPLHYFSKLTYVTSDTLHPTSLINFNPSVPVKFLVEALQDYGSYAFPSQPILFLLILQNY